VQDIDTLVKRYFQDHWKHIYEYAVKRCGSIEDARDLAQIAFMKLHRALADGRAIDNPRAWLKATVHDAAVDYLRHKDTRIQYESDVALSLSAPPPRTPEDILAERMRKDLLKAALRRLTPLQRSVLILRGQGMKLHQIATHLGLDNHHRVVTLLVQAHRELGRHFRG